MPAAFRYHHVCLGGTFSPLHRGHKALLLTALSLGKHAFIGVTDGDLAQRNRSRAIPPAAERVRAVRELLDARGVGTRAEVAAITHPFGRALEPQFEAIVVTPDTRATADQINKAREEKRLKPLAVEVVPLVLGLDGLPISATRVAAGEIDPDGVSPKRLHIAVGSDNPVKVSAARRAIGRWVPDVHATPVHVDSGVPPQPYDAQGPQGAIARARAALAKVADAGLGVGIEAAIVKDPLGGAFDVQYAAIADRQDRVTWGAGPGFAYPQKVHDHLATGKTVGEAMHEIVGRGTIGREEGAIGHLTRMGVTREELTEWAVLMAMVPRLRPELYAALPFE